MKQHVVKLILLLALFLLVPPVWAQGLSVDSISPNSATVGDSNVSVTIVLTGDGNPPNMDSVTIGSISGTNLSYNSSTKTLTTNFDFSSASAGTYDVVVTFTSPNGTETITEADGFTISRVGGSAVIYVDVDSSTANPDGTAWSTAYPDLQNALSQAVSGDEIWIAEGTYYPTSGTDRTISFELATGVSVYGGFAGTETARSQRDPATHKTVLSGNIGTTNTATDNSYHVLVGANNMTLDGVTVSGGYADGANGDPRHLKGGGMINYDTSGTGYSPTLNQMTFEANYAEEGGAMYNYDYTTPQISNSTFQNNTAKRGGALLNRVAGDTFITDTTFINNSAEWRGGAIAIDYGTDAAPTFTRVTFESNSTNGHGGAIYVDDFSSQVGVTSPIFDDCTFTGNSATYFGGAAFIYNKATPTFQNSAFNNNSAGSGGGAVAVTYDATVTLNNNTYSGNSATQNDNNIYVFGTGTCSGNDC